MPAWLRDRLALAYAVRVDLTRTIQEDQELCGSLRQQVKVVGIGRDGEEDGGKG